MRILSMLFFLFIDVGLYAQSAPLQGYVASENDELLTGAIVYWEGTTTATTTAEDGSFQIERPDTSAILLIQYVGYDPVSVRVTPAEQDIYITLTGIKTLQAVEVTGEQLGNYVSTLSTVNIEHITSRELKKAACCNLAESFETNATVDVGHTNAVTGTSEIQMLGLRGIYSQLLIENRPTMNGLAQPFSLEYIPGTWVEGIQISKGASSVANGPQSMTGQVNVELVKPTTDAPLFVNLFANHLGRYEGNLHLNRAWSDKLATGFLFHASTQSREIDDNKDSFRDLPLKNQLNGMYRMFYQAGPLEGQLNVHAIRHHQSGGQLDNLPDPWRIDQDNDRLEVYGKNGYVFSQDQFSSIGFIYNAYVHQYNGRYGARSHQGDQRGGYLNLLYNREGKSPYNNYTAGYSFNYDDIREDLFGVNFDRKDIVNGAFVQYGYGSEKNLADKRFSWQDFAGLIAGVRADYHQRYGWYITPRVNARVNLDSRTIIRMSAGRGWRNPNFPPDWQAMLFSNRSLQVLDKLRPEDAWVYGLNFTKNMTVFDHHAFSIVADLFHTRFTNQIVMDMEASHTQILLYNLDGKSFSNSALFMATMEVLHGMDVKLAWKYNDVRTTYLGNLESLPMVPLHRILATVDYVTPNDQWRFNVTAQGVGSMRLPSHTGIPAEVIGDRPQESPVYTLFNAQVSWTYKTFEIYLGGENLGNYKQQNPILDWQNPTSPHFDASRVFAPIVGTRIYTGLRYSLGKKTEDH
ncbi:MAG: carboxypeptidase-like regulatory domain-containing protein [Saprospiraceae bacterium]|nr:carboxypeptidase-like regulatory domain-containing protein [Saprospiraceae bacterium]